MSSEILSYISDEDIGKELTNEIVVAVKKIYSNNGFVIFACDGGFTVKGNFATEIVEGAQYQVTGRVGSYNRQMQIAASSITQVKNDKSKEAYIAAFIVDSFSGIGKVTAALMAEKYKEKILHELLHNYKEVAKEISGLSSVRARECSELIDENEKFLVTSLRLRMLGLTKHQTEEAYATFGFSVDSEVYDNPYILMRCSGIGFETCERIAEGLEIDLLNPLRFEGAIKSVVEKLHVSSGDTYFDPAVVKADALELLKVNGEEFDQNVVDSAYDFAIEKAISNKHIVVYHFAEGKCISCSINEKDARISSMLYFRMEAAIKREMESFLKASVVEPDVKRAKKKILEIATEFGITPDESQMKALIMCMYQPFSIITGGPGTGKTTITGILARHFEKENIKCEYCAPTGRAAKRLSEAAGVKANTIHRLLEMSADAEANDGSVCFGRNQNNPIDARVILVDEASMVDTSLFCALLNAIKKNASVILIGDPNQLPAVGAGNVLSDLLSLDLIPRVCLEYVFRQSDESSIASNSCRILKGEKLISNDEDFTIIETSNDSEALEVLKKLYVDYKNLDCAILCPTKQNVLGTASLNYELQDLLIEDKSSGTKVRADLTLYKGDRVMQVKNNYQIEYYDANEMSIVNGIFNGEIGVVEGGDFLVNTCAITFDGERKVDYDKKMLADIELAYAMTVHKAQGCEFDVVIVALGKMSYKLSNRKLLYTAVTRGKKKVIIVDSEKRLNKMISSDVNEVRRTSLKDFLNILKNRYS